jgi:glycosyltransferase involved in cell wall biosynthesis
MRKIKIVSQLFFPELVSTGQSMTQLAESLKERGFEIEVICGPPTLLETKGRVEKTINYNGILIHRVFSTRFPKLKFWGKLINHITFSLSVFFTLLKEPRKSMILTITNPPFLPFICALARIFGGPRFIVKVADVYPDTAVKLDMISSTGFINLVWSWLNKLVFKKAEALIVLGRCMESLMKGKIKKKHQDKIKPIHIWTDDELIIARMNELNLKPSELYMKKWNLEGKFIVLYSGNLGRFHDLETIMYAAKELNQIDPDILFLFVGEGYKKSWCETFSQENILENCRFETYVPRSDQADVLSCVNCGVVSLDERMVGISVPSKTYAIMAASQPVLAILPKTSEIAMMIEETNSGRVIENGDVKALCSHILELKNDKNLNHSLGENAAEAIQTKYSLKKAAQEYDNLISNLMKES